MYVILTPILLPPFIIIIIIRIHLLSAKTFAGFQSVFSQNHSQNDNEVLLT